MVGPEEHAALQVVLGGLKDGLAALPVASVWTPCLREIRNVLDAQMRSEQPPEPQHRGPSEQGDLAA